MFGRLWVTCLDVEGAPPRGELVLSLEHQMLSSVGHMARLAHGHTALFANLPIRPQGQYRLTVSGNNYLRTARFLELVTPAARLTVTVALKPGAVKGILLPPGEPDPWPVEAFPEMTDEQRAGFLNIRAKARATRLSDGRSVFDAFGEILELRPDRIIVRVPPWLVDVLDDTAELKHVSGVLHHPPPGYAEAASYKTADEYGNLQITLFECADDWIADVDIDDAAGFEHLFQVARNALTGRPTHPYAIHEILRVQGLDPGYRLQV